MERGGRLIGVLIVILALISALWLFNFFYQQPRARVNVESFVQSALGSKVLIIDMNADDKPLLPDVFTGEDALLVIHQGDNPANHDRDTVYANDIILAFFDLNKDGRIDAHDPSIYKRLELKYYDKTRDGFVGYMPVAQAGIRAIYIDPKYYSKFGSEDLFPRPIGTAIMADGTARLLRQVVVDESYLHPGQAATTPLPAMVAPVSPVTSPVTSGTVAPVPTPVTPATIQVPAQ